MLGDECAALPQRPFDFTNVVAAMPVDDQVKSPIREGQFVLAVRCLKVDAQRQQRVFTDLNVWRITLRRGRAVIRVIQGQQKLAAPRYKILNFTNTFNTCFVLLQVDWNYPY